MQLYLYPCDKAAMATLGEPLLRRGAATACASASTCRSTAAPSPPAASPKAPPGSTSTTSATARAVPPTTIELARTHHTIILSYVPLLTSDDDNSARRFINLVDEFYDRGVKLLIAAEAPMQQLYSGTKLKFEFERTVSRLIEMQSQEYLAKPHLT